MKITVLKQFRLLVIKLHKEDCEREEPFEIPLIVGCCTKVEKREGPPVETMPCLRQLVDRGVLEPWYLLTDHSVLKRPLDPSRVAVGAPVSYFEEQVRLGNIEMEGANED